MGLVKPANIAANWPTTPPLRGTPPQEGNLNSGAEVPYSPPVEGWQAKPDGVVLPISAKIMMDKPFN